MAKITEHYPSERLPQKVTVQQTCKCSAHVQRVEHAARALLQAIDSANAEEDIDGRLDAYAFLYGARMQMWAMLNELPSEGADGPV